MKCKTCGLEGDCGGSLPECANCWEVEGRLETYLRSVRGKAFVLRALGYPDFAALLQETHDQAIEAAARVADVHDARTLDTTADEIRALKSSPATVQSDEEGQKHR